MITEAQKRDKAIQLLEINRIELIQAARNAAFKIARFYGQVTSPEVIELMRDTGYSQQLDSVDHRFMGAVFKDRIVWEHIGYSNTGSHCRPVSIWRLK